MPKRPFKDDIAAGDKHEEEYPTDGVATLAKHIEIYAVNKQVPEDLSKHVSDTREAQEAWYAELLKAWRNWKATPTPEEATELVLNTLKKIYHDCVDVADLEGFLYFYRLPHYASLPKPNSPSPVAEDKAPELFVLNTLPVDKNKVIDGRHFSVSVHIQKFSLLPSKILFAILERRIALEKMDQRRADDLLKVINTEDYQVMYTNTLDEVLTQKYKIRLRGFEESGRFNDDEARSKLVKMVDGKCLMIKVLYIDEDLHCVGDAYWEGTLLQKDSLVEGSATRFDHAPGVSKGNPLIEMETDMEMKLD